MAAVGHEDPQNSLQNPSPAKSSAIGSARDRYFRGSHCVGDLLFVLTGMVGGLRAQTQEVDSGKVKEIRLVPSLTGADVQRTCIKCVLVEPEADRVFRFHLRGLLVAVLHPKYARSAISPASKSRLQRHLQ